jgi:hypothetical protein
MGWLKRCSEYLAEQKEWAVKPKHVGPHCHPSLGISSRPIARIARTRCGPRAISSLAPTARQRPLVHVEVRSWKPDRSRMAMPAASMQSQGG